VDRKILGQVWKTVPRRAAIKALIGTNLEPKSLRGGVAPRGDLFNGNVAIAIRDDLDNPHQQQCLLIVRKIGELLHGSILLDPSCKRFVCARCRPRRSGTFGWVGVHHGLGRLTAVVGLLATCLRGEGPDGCVRSSDFGAARQRDCLLAGGQSRSHRFATKRPPMAAACVCSACSSQPSISDSTNVTTREMPIITQTESSRSAPPIMGLSLRTGWMVESRQLVKTGPSATNNHRFAVKTGEYPSLRKQNAAPRPLVNSIKIPALAGGSS
jgi:hypothetical protein